MGGPLIGMFPPAGQASRCPVEAIDDDMGALAVVR